MTLTALGMRRGRLAAAFVLVFVALVLVTACGAGAKTGNPALPAGFTELGIPDVELRAYAYVNAGTPSGLPAGMFGQRSTDVGDLQAVSIQTAVHRPSSEYAARVEFVDAADAERAGVAAAARAGADAWTVVDGRSLIMGQPDNAEWTRELRNAWAGMRYIPVEEAYPDVWGTLQLLLEEPPATPVAVGFARNISQIVQQMLEPAQLSVPGLDSAFNLMRVETGVVAVYGDNISQLPQFSSRNALRDYGMSVLAVTTSTYPAFVVSFLFPRFAERAGLEESTVDGKPVLYRALDDDLHLIVRNYGSSFFFALAATREGAEDVVRSVIASQGAR